MKGETTNFSKKLLVHPPKTGLRLSRADRIRLEGLRPPQVDGGNTLYFR